MLAVRASWPELKSCLEQVSDRAIIAEYDSETDRYRTGRRRQPPKGAQPALNSVIKRELQKLGWAVEPRLFQVGQASTLRRWKMDFLKERIGVEVVFNHAEAIAWAFTRMHMAGESDEVITSNRIDVGVAVFATEALKQWGRMDGAVGTFEMAREWLRVMRPILPMPIQLVGLEPEGFTDIRPFLGTGGRLEDREAYPDPPGE